MLHKRILRRITVKGLSASVIAHPHGTTLILDPKLGSLHTINARMRQAATSSVIISMRILAYTIMSTNQTTGSIIGVLLHRLIIRARSLDNTHQTIQRIVLIVGHLTGSIDNTANLPGRGIREMRTEP